MYNKGRKKKYNKFEKAIESEIDFHGLRLKEAQAAFVDFIEVSLRRDLGRVRIITGKGLHSSDGIGVIKDMVLDILKANGIKNREGKPDEGGGGVIIADFD
jgi:DNA-nicking Smr family endonuclease